MVLFDNGFTVRAIIQVHKNSQVLNKMASLMWHCVAHSDFSPRAEKLNLLSLGRGLKC